MTSRNVSSLNDDLMFGELSETNARRANRWHGGFPMVEDGWTIADWSNAMCGEAGEAANVVKKIRRLDTGIQQAEQGDRSEDEMRSALIYKLAKELGDTIIYADLLATKAGISLADAVVYAFNQVSDREGFPEKL